MGSSLLQLIALAAIALYLIFRLRNQLGSRDGFEPPRQVRKARDAIDADEDEPEDKVDSEVAKYVPDDLPSAKALQQMKRVERDFSIADFVEGACNAYEMILVSFAQGDLERVEDFLSDNVLSSFEQTIADRHDEDITYVARFVGLRKTTVRSATFDTRRKGAEITIEFDCELISYGIDEDGEVVEGDESTIRRQRDVWTFARTMGTDDPNWMLVATGE